MSRGPEAIGGFDNGGGTGHSSGWHVSTNARTGRVHARRAGGDAPGTRSRAGRTSSSSGARGSASGAGRSTTITIMVGRGATASGRVVFEGSTPPPPSPGQARVPLYNPDGPGCRSAASDDRALTGRFKVEGLSGTCGAQPTSMFGRWTLKAVTLRGQNLMDQLVTFETGQQYTNVQVVVTDKRTQMDLRVSRRRRPADARVRGASRFRSTRRRWTSAAAAGPDARSAADRAMNDGRWPRCRLEPRPRATWRGRLSTAR